MTQPRMNVFIRMGNGPSTHMSNIIQLNQFEYLTAGENKYDRTVKGLYKYNVKTNKWTLFIKYPNDLKISFHGICYNSSMNIIYIFCSENMMVIIDVTTKTFKVNKINSLNRSQSQYPVLLSIHDKCHVIGHCDSKCHLIWNDKQESFDKLYEFPYLKAGILGHGVIRIHSKQMLLLFGGYDYDSDEGRQNAIWKCDLNTMKWQKMNILLPKRLYHFGYVLSINERYLFLFGGIEHNYSTKIYFLDLNTMIFYESRIQIPDNGMCWAFLYCDEKNILLVDGYIRWMADKLNINIPIELVKLCEQYAVSEYLHLISKHSKSHYKCDLNDIINANKMQCNK